MTYPSLQMRLMFSIISVMFAKLQFGKRISVAYLEPEP